MSRRRDEWTAPRIPISVEIDGVTPKDPNSVMAASALSVPMSLIMGIADLLIQKGIISSNEVAAIAQALSAASNCHGENEAMVKMMLEGFAVRFEAPREREAGH
jgi:hypothetical protein